MSEQLKIGLIGAGVFASYHANKLSDHKRVSFTGVVDASGKRASFLAAKHGVANLPLPELLEASDAVVIAAPAIAHQSLAVQAMEAGCHCLIEKPLAISVEDAAAITALATSKSLTVQVGHQERMVLRAIGLDRVKERALKIEAVRHSPFSMRGTDTSVTFDLMTHDIDLCTALMGAAPDEVFGQTGCVRSQTADMAYAHLRYGASSVRLSASRVAEQSERWMKLTYPSGDVFIDFNAKTLTHTTPFELNTNFAESPLARDSLGSATDNFVRAVLDGDPVLVSAEDGAIAVRTAVKIDEGRLG